MKRYRVGILVALSSILGILWGCGDKPHESPPAKESAVIAQLKALPPSGAQVDFTKKEVPDYLRVDGLSVPEAFGRWSDGENVTLTFGSNLPVKFNLTIWAMAFGPNISSPIRVKVGDQVKEYKFSAATGEYSQDYANVSATDKIEISIPHPVVPNDKDSRRIGLGIAGLVLKPIK